MFWSYSSPFTTLRQHTKNEQSCIRNGGGGGGRDKGFNKHGHLVGVSSSFCDVSRFVGLFFFKGSCLEVNSYVVHLKLSGFYFHEYICSH